MMVIPAIDILNGRAVRLRKGLYSNPSVYDVSILEIATRYAKQGANLIHVVDLDAADGRPDVNSDAIKYLVASAGVPLQLGGGLRSYSDIKRALDMGFSRVVTGTMVVEDLSETARVARDFPGRLIAALDSRHGRIAVRGWKQQTTKAVEEVAGQLLEIGIRDFLCTDIERDGMLSGPSTGLVRKLSAMGARALISGGIGSLAHLEELTQLGLPEETGVIIGRALYEGVFTLTEAIHIIEGGRQSGIG